MGSQPSSRLALSEDAKKWMVLRGDRAKKAVAVSGECQALLQGTEEWMVLQGGSASDHTVRMLGQNFRPGCQVSVKGGLVAFGCKGVDGFYGFAMPR